MFPIFPSHRHLLEYRNSIVLRVKTIKLSTTKLPPTFITTSPADTTILLST